MGLRRAARDELLDAKGIARLSQVLIVIGGHHCDAEEFQRRALNPELCRRKRLRIGMDGQKARAEARDLRRSLGHGGWNVMQLEVEKHLFALRDEILRERQAASIGKLHPDFVKGHALAKP